MTELVKNNHGELFTNSKVISDMLEVAHKDLLRTIEQVLETKKNSVLTSTLKFPQKFIETTFTNKMGRTYKMYNLNKIENTLCKKY